jgi:hypothetical protein
MVSAGVFEEDERLELLEGVVVEMSPWTPRHALTIARLCDAQFAPVGPDCALYARAPTAGHCTSVPAPVSSAPISAHKMT